MYVLFRFSAAAQCKALQYNGTPPGNCILISDNSTSEDGSMFKSDSSNIILVYWKVYWSCLSICLSVYCIIGWSLPHPLRQRPNSIPPTSTDSGPAMLTPTQAQIHTSCCTHICPIPALSFLYRVHAGYWLFQCAPVEVFLTLMVGVDLNLFSTGTLIILMVWC